MYTDNHNYDLNGITAEIKKAYLCVCVWQGQREYWEQGDEGWVEEVGRLHNIKLGLKNGFQNREVTAAHTKGKEWSGAQEEILEINVANGRMEQEKKIPRSEKLKPNPKSTMEKEKLLAGGGTLGGYELNYHKQSFSESQIQEGLLYVYYSK